MQIDTNGFEINDVVRDSVTGLEGKIVGITQWTTGCARASVQPKISEKEPHKIPDSYSIDVLNLELVEAGDRHFAPPKPELVGANRGGPATAVPYSER